MTPIGKAIIVSRTECGEHADRGTNDRSQLFHLPRFRYSGFKNGQVMQMTHPPHTQRNTDL